MRTYVLVQFFIYLALFVMNLLLLGLSSDKRWENISSLLIATGFGLWAACLLWR